MNMNTNNIDDFINIIKIDENLCKIVNFQNHTYKLYNNILYHYCKTNLKLEIKIIAFDVLDIKKDIHGISYISNYKVYIITLDGTGMSGCIGYYPGCW